MHSGPGRRYDLQPILGGLNTRIIDNSAWKFVPLSCDMWLDSAFEVKYVCLSPTWILRKRSRIS